MTRNEPLFEIPDSIEEKILRRIPREILYLSIAFSVPVFVLFDPISALFFILGGIMTALNFLWFKKEVTKFLVYHKKKAVKSLLSLYGLRIVLIIGVFSIIIFFFSKKILAFAAGFSMLIPVALVEAAVGLLKLKTWKN